MSKPNAKHPWASSAAEPSIWPRKSTMDVKTKVDGVAGADPSVAEYTPPTDTDRAAEEPERWDGLS